MHWNAPCMCLHGARACTHAPHPCMHCMHVCTHAVHLRALHTSRALHLRARHWLSRDELPPPKGVVRTRVKRSALHCAQCIVHCGCATVALPLAQWHRLLCTCTAHCAVLRHTALLCSDLCTATALFQCRSTGHCTGVQCTAVVHCRTTVPPFICEL